MGSIKPLPNSMNGQIILIVLLFLFSIIIPRLIFMIKRRVRRNYYHNNYLKSDEWRRKRYVVLKRDNWRCVYCGAPATQVHHKKYAKKILGRNQSNGYCQSAIHVTILYITDEKNHYILLYYRSFLIWFRKNMTRIYSS